MPEEERHSKAADAELISDPEEKARREASNGLRQASTVNEMVEYWLQPKRPFKLRVSQLLTLNRIALEGLSAYAGNFRPGPVAIQGSKHQPVGAHLVPERLEELCDYVNTNLHSKSAIHLAAYVLWRLNWIHPFADGNGRTARAAAYLVMCVTLQLRLPGSKTIPEQISNDKTPYYKALEAADAADANRTLDVSQLETLLGDLLAKQLLDVHQRATGR
jgi:Fic family protein